jgi:hypothetical protein
MLPILILPIGAYLLLTSPPATFGTANIWVDQVSLQQLSYIDQGVPPAQNMSNYLTQLLLSPSFDYGVAKSAPLYQQYLKSVPVPKGITPNLRLLAAADLSKKSTATANGPNLVTINYESTSPTVAAQVVRSILKEAAYETIQLAQQQTNKDIAYYGNQLKKSHSAYTTAVGNLGTYMAVRGIKSSELALQQLSNPRLASLYQAVQITQTNLTNAQQQLAHVETQQTSQSTIRVLDPPSAQIVLTSKKKQLTKLLIPLVLGLILSGAFIVIMTLRDPSLRSASLCWQYYRIVKAQDPPEALVAHRRRRARRHRNGHAVEPGRGLRP